MGRPKTIDELFALVAEKLRLSDDDLIAQIKNAGGAESLTPALVRDALNKILANRAQLTTEFNNSTTAGHIFKKPEDYDPDSERTDVLVRDPSTMEFYLFINTNFDRIDGTKIGVYNDEENTVEKFAVGGKDKSLKNSFECLGDNISLMPKLALKNKSDDSPIIPENVLMLTRDPELKPYVTQYLQASITQGNHTRYFLWTDFKPYTLASVLDTDISGGLGDMIKALEALVAFHKKGLSHGDLKFENFHADKKHNPTIGDLDGAKTFGSELIIEGTPIYMSPEVLRVVFKSGKKKPEVLQEKIVPVLEQKSYAYYVSKQMLENVYNQPQHGEPEKATGKEDVWAFGIMLLEVVKKHRMDDLLSDAFNANPDLRNKPEDILGELLKGVDADLATPIRKALNPERSLRASAADILTDLKKYKKLEVSTETTLETSTFKPASFGLKPLLEVFQAEPKKRLDTAKTIFHYLGRFVKEQDYEKKFDFQNEQSLTACLKSILEIKSPKMKGKSIMEDATWRSEKSRNELIPLAAQFMLQVIQPAAAKTHSSSSTTPLFNMQELQQENSKALEKIVDLDNAINASMSPKSIHEAYSPSPKQTEKKHF